MELLYYSGMIGVTHPEKHLKGWGCEYWIVNNSDYCSKILYFEKDKRMSWHFHKVKTETFYVLSGRLILLVGQSDDIKEAQEVELKENDTFTIHRETRHQLIALEYSKVIETSTQHFEEDSYRIIKGD
jgi:mannose-6-phosphate isomerase-like protein (cupin superfamily)